MNTPSHLIINAALRKGVRRTVAIPRSAFLLGSIAPDIPLYLLSIGGFIYYRQILGWSAERTFRHMFDTLFFTDPGWIFFHNILHSPTFLLIVLTLLWKQRQRLGVWPRWAFWFFAGCLIHTAVDIPVHTNDGPLLFFPFEWHLRFISPLSYWDTNHYGGQFAVFEVVLDIVLLIYLFGPSIRRWFAARRSTASPATSGEAQ